MAGPISAFAVFPDKFRDVETERVIMRLRPIGAGLDYTEGAFVQFEPPNTGFWDITKTRLSYIPQITRSDGLGVYDGARTKVLGGADVDVTAASMSQLGDQYGSMGGLAVGGPWNAFQRQRNSFGNTLWEDNDGYDKWVTCLWQQTANEAQRMNAQTLMALPNYLAFMQDTWFASFAAMGDSSFDHDEAENEIQRGNWLYLQMLANQNNQRVEMPFWCGLATQSQNIPLQFMPRCLIEFQVSTGVRAAWVTAIGETAVTPVLTVRAPELIVEMVRYPAAVEAQIGNMIRGAGMNLYYTAITHYVSTLPGNQTTCDIAIPEKTVSLKSCVILAQEDASQSRCNWYLNSADGYQQSIKTNGTNTTTSIIIDATTGNVALGTQIGAAASVSTAAAVPTANCWIGFVGATGDADLDKNTALLWRKAAKYTSDASKGVLSLVWLKPLKTAPSTTTKVVIYKLDVNQTAPPGVFIDPFLKIARTLAPASYDTAYNASTSTWQFFLNGYPVPQEPVRAFGLSAQSEYETIKALHGLGFSNQWNGTPEWSYSRSGPNYSVVDTDKPIPATQDYLCWFQKGIFAYKFEALPYDENTTISGARTAANVGVLNFRANLGADGILGKARLTGNVNARYDIFTVKDNIATVSAAGISIMK